MNALKACAEKGTQAHVEIVREIISEMRKRKVEQLSLDDAAYSFDFVLLNYWIFYLHY